MELTIALAVSLSAQDLNAHLRCQQTAMDLVQVRRRLLLNKT